MLNNRVVRWNMLVLITGGVLSACQGTLAPTPSPSSQSTLRTQAVLLPKPELSSVQAQLKISTQIMSGPMREVASSESGLEVAYRFTPGGVQMRVDTPKEQYSDGQARTLLIDTAARTAQVLNQGTQRLERSATGDAVLSKLISNVGAQIGLLDLERPFQTQTGEQFLVRSRTAGFQLETKGATEWTVVQKLIQGEAQQTTRLIYSSALGTVSRMETLTESPLNRVQATTNYTYSVLPTKGKALFPKEIKSRITTELLGKARVAPMVLPKADRVLAPGEQPNVGPNEYIANRFTAPHGQGIVDVNTMVLEGTVRFENVQVNQLEQSFFELGGAK